MSSYGVTRAAFLVVILNLSALLQRVNVETNLIIFRLTTEMSRRRKWKLTSTDLTCLSLTQYHSDIIQRVAFPFSTKKFCCGRPAEQAITVIHVTLEVQIDEINGYSFFMKFDSCPSFLDCVKLHFIGLGKHPLHSVVAQLGEKSWTLHNQKVVCCFQFLRSLQVEYH